MAGAFQSASDIQVQRDHEGNLLESEEYLSAKGKVMIPLGATEDGSIIIRDLSTIPHILICGFTGTGKTAFVQTLLSVLMSKQSPDDVKILIYDSKRIEYGIFSNAPHLYLPIIYDRDKAVAAIKYLAEESRRRFRLFADTGCKDYEKYNALHSDDSQKLPELFMILDDFSALSIDKNEMYELLNVLKNGRIAGIHVIVISSMTSTKVLQKELVSNIPCRICFRLSSKAESRSVLEQAGAEELFVPGEMIYKFQNDFCKCQSAYATYENIGNVMKSVCHAVASVTALGIEASMLFSDIPVSNSSSLGYLESDYDELLSDAAELVIESGRGSVSMLQRKFRIGFNRAARMLDQLESLGVVGGQAGSVLKEVLMTTDDWNAMCSSEGLKRIDNNIGRPSPSVQTRQSFVSTRSFSEPEPQKEEEPEIKLRDFAEFAIADSKISIHDNEIHFTKPIMTRLGPGTATPSFSAKNVTGLIYKKPTLFSPGYMTFEFDPSTKIDNKNPYLLHADIYNISDLIKIEFKSGHDRMIQLFLQQLSEDIGVPIKRL